MKSGKKVRKKKMIKQLGQLYWDDSIVNLTKDEISSMVNEDYFAPKYEIAINHFHSLTDRLNNCVPSDFQWLKLEYTVPFFADLVFRCKNKVFAIIFAQMNDDGFLNNISYINNSITFCKKNNLIPSLLVFDKDNNIINLTSDKWALLDASKYYNEGSIVSIAPDELSTDEFIEASNWELYNSAVMAIVEDLCNKQKIRELLYQSYLGIDPCICYLDKESIFNWMVIRVIKDDEDRIEEPKELLETIKKNNGLGHYGLCKITNPYGKNVYPRGQAFDYKFEIADLK